MVNSYRHQRESTIRTPGLIAIAPDTTIPRLGGFIQEDPIMFGGGVDFYLYTANSPVESFFTESRAFSEGRGEPWMPTKVFGMQ